MRGLRAHDVPVVGVEATDAEPSQVEWYNDHGLSSVDDLDDPIGRAALVFALAGERRRLRREGNRRRRPAPAAAAVTRPTSCAARGHGRPLPQLRCRSARPPDARRARRGAPADAADPAAPAGGGLHARELPRECGCRSRAGSRSWRRGCWRSAACSAVATIADVDLLDVGPPLDLTYLLGVALLGLIDDLLAGASRGWRGHGRRGAGRRVQHRRTEGGRFARARAVRRFRQRLGDGVGEYLLAVALLVLTTNLFNLLDLRPGRSAKAFLLLGALLSVVAWHGRYDGPASRCGSSARSRRRSSSSASSTCASARCSATRART